MSKEYPWWQQWIDRRRQRGYASNAWNIYHGHPKKKSKLPVVVLTVLAILAVVVLLNL